MQQLEKVNILPDRQADGAVPVVQTDADSIMAVISRAASDPNTDVDKLERLLGLYERITAKSAEQAFNEALQAAQTEMRPVAADALNPQTRSKYASYLALDRALRPIYTKHGFSISFDEGDSPKPDHVRVLAYVSHKDGHSRTYHKDMPADGKGAKGGDVMTKTHAVGAASSYGARYLLKGIFNVAIGEDDRDGNDPPSSFITQAQVEQLVEMIEATEADRDRFLAFFKVGSLSELPANRFNEAMAMLNAKRSRS